MRPALLGALLATLSLAACGESSQPLVHLMKEGDPMPPTSTAARPGLPAIDSALPATLETASFALG